MRKPMYLIPCIFVYKMFIMIVKYIILYCKYIYKGIITFCVLIFRLFINACLILYKLSYYFFKGIYTIISIPLKVINKNSNKKVVKNKIKQINQSNIDLKEFKRLRNLWIKESKRLKKNNLNSKHFSKVRKTKDDIIKDKKQKQNEIFVNENIKQKKSISEQRISDFFKMIGSIPKKIKEKFINNEFVKHKNNKDMLKKEALLINFEGEDAEKSETKLIYEYVAKNPEGKIVKDYFEAFSKVEVHSFLLSEGFEVYSIKTNKWIQMMYKNANTNNTKFKTKDLVFFLTQLSTYIKAGIPLVESLRILERQYKNKKYKKILKSLIYDLTMGDNFSDALLKQNVAFPKLLINMVKTAEMTGELPEVLDDQAEYYNQSQKVKKQMVTAMMYPMIVFTASIAVAIFIMIVVIPQFVEIYESIDASQIPTFTLVVLAISDFLKAYAIWLIIGLIVVIIVFIYMYKTIKVFRTACQWIAMKIPVVGTAIIYNEVTMFTKTFSSLLKHNVFITDSMEVLNKITNNEIYKMIILDTITNLAKGDKISAAFKDNWAFPVPAYEMLVTGEKTGELPEMMEKVSNYYQELHADTVTRIKTLMEPLITVFLTVIVGTLILSIIIPMFGMYNTVQTV